MLIGYARTSTANNSGDMEAQERELRAAGAERVWSEQISGVGDRPVLTKCVEFLRKGDALIVTKPDRLARSTAELLLKESLPST
jgi:DNA invertase Pin-like site-specific DNA recombinase